ncbi:MAG: 7TM diverse intracellular signaling domain-containing protein [Bacteroidia bacterium]
MSKAPFVLFFLLLFSQLTAAKNDTLFIEQSFKRSALPVSAAVFSDVSFETKADMISRIFETKGIELQSQQVNFGYIKSAFWFRLIIKNNSFTDKQLIVSLENPNIDSISFFANYGPGYNHIGSAGDHIPRSEWVMGSRQPAVGIMLEPEESVSLLIKARNSYSGNMILPLRVWDANHFHNFQQGYQLSWGFYLGFLLINMALAFSATILLRARIFVWYGVFLLASLVYTATSFGFTYQYFTGSIPASNDYIRTAFLILISSSMLKFSQHFLKTKEISPNTHVILNIIIIVQLGLLASSFVFSTVLRANFNVLFPWFLMLILTGYVLLFIAAFAARKPYRLRANAFLLAFSFSLAGGIVLIFTDLNLLPYNGFTIHAPWIGSAFEIVIFTGIMFYEFKLVGDQKVRLEQQIAEEQTQRLKEFFRGQEKERERISRELHDNVAGTLVGARFLMPAAEKLADFLPENALLSYERALHTLDRSIKDVRNLSHNLQPPTLSEQSLKYELERLIADYKTMSPGTNYHFTYRLKDGLLSNDMAIAIYRVCQECLLNIFKHAYASSVHIMLETDNNNLKMYITDNGMGFDTHKVGAGIGLQNIKSRLAFTKNLKTRIDSAADQGTHISLSFDL